MLSHQVSALVFMRSLMLMIPVRLQQTHAHAKNSLWLIISSTKELKRREIRLSCLFMNGIEPRT